MKKLYIASSLAATCVLLLVTTSSAQAADDADSLFRAGRKAAESGDYATACTKFAESLRLDPAAGTLLNLGECSENTGHLIKASEYYRLAAAAFKRTDERRNTANKRAADIDTRVCNLTLRKGIGFIDGAVVARNGSRVDLSDFDRPLVIDPGHVELVVSAKGREDRTYRFDLAEKVSREVTLEAGEELFANSHGSQNGGNAGDPATPPPKSETSHTQRTIGIVSVATGGALIAVGAILGFSAMSAADTYNANCTNKICRNQDGLDAAHSVETIAPLATWTLIAGGVIAAVGATLWITAPTGKTPADKASTDRAVSAKMRHVFSPQSVRFAPSIGWDQASRPNVTGSLSGSF